KVEFVVFDQVIAPYELQEASKRNVHLLIAFFGFFVMPMAAKFRSKILLFFLKVDPNPTDFKDDDIGVKPLALKTSLSLLKSALAVCS
ncbi:MAG TPA: hypothetical protein VHK69_05460, partial [Chitinophagaceae bacterium]|nr:hypothetical protein [Chitinophagaceae bacterium]